MRSLKSRAAASKTREFPHCACAQPPLTIAALHPIPSEAVQIGVALPFALRDASGALVVARGAVIGSDSQWQSLAERELFLDEHDSETLARAVNGKVDSMVRQGALLGKIAQARAHGGPASAAARRVEDPLTAWSSLQVRASVLLHAAPQDAFAPRLAALQAELLDLLERDTDLALLILIQGTTGESRNYSVGHALLVAVVCELAARHLVAWPVAWREPLRCAALTMNIAMTTLQDVLALQETPPTPQQRALIDRHGALGAARLREYGIGDAMWLEAVEQHHATRAGKLAELGDAQQLARLIQRADIFAARLSRRRTRSALSGMAAAKATYLDENQQADEAGAAIIKATGIYPPGSYVRLASGEVAVVLRRGRLANEPVVASVISAAGMPLGEPARRDTRVARFAVSAGVAPQDVRLRLNLERLLSLA